MLLQLADKKTHTAITADEILTGERLGPGGLRGLQIRREASKMSLVGSTPIRSRHHFNIQRKQACEEKTIVPEKMPS